MSAPGPRDQRGAAAIKKADAIQISHGASASSFYMREAERLRDLNLAHRAYDKMRKRQVAVRMNDAEPLGEKWWGVFRFCKDICRVLSQRGTTLSPKQRDVLCRVIGCDLPPVAPPTVAASPLPLKPPGRR